MKLIQLLVATLLLVFAGSAFAQEEEPDKSTSTPFTVPVSFGNSTVLEIRDEAGIKHYTLEIVKTAPRLIYPLKFLHRVPYYPYEEVIVVENINPSTPACVDSPEAVNPTCGWTYTGVEKIEYSQGFCCSKDPKAMNENSGPWRGEELLADVPTPTKAYSTAHCLRLGEDDGDGPLFFDGFEIVEPNATYEITFTLKKEEDGDKQVYKLTSENPVFSAVDEEPFPFFGLHAELLSRLSEHRGVPELGNYILYIPSAPDSHPYVRNYPRQMLLVPREEVSRDGSELDKVGTSFRAFSKMGGDCAQTVAGDGLHNQLYHRFEADDSKINANPNLDATWLVHGKRPFKGSMVFVPGMEKVLEYKVVDVNYSTIALSFDPDFDLVPAQVEWESTAVILDAYVEDFESMSSNGNLVVEIINFGGYKADYIVTVTECDFLISKAIPAQARTLFPRQSAILYFDIFTKDSEDERNRCVVTLKSPTGKVYDGPLDVFFDTVPHKVEYSWELLQKNEGSVKTVP